MAQSAKNGHIELKLVVDNSSFKSGLEGAKKALGGLSSESLKVGNGLKTAGKNAQDAANKLKGLGTTGAAENLGKLRGNITSALGDLTKGFSSAGDAAQKFGNVATVAIGTVAGNAITRLLAKVSDLTSAMITMPIKTAANFEMVRASFDVLIGDTNKAKEVFTDIQNLAAKTPLQFGDLLDNSRLLLNFGQDVNTLLPTLKMLGDISGGNVQRFNQLSLAFAQSQAAGKLMGQDLLQMVNAGFNPLMIISEKTGKSINTLRQEMADGKLTFDQVRQAFIDATTEGGKFFNLMDKQSGTTLGLWSTLKDNIELTGAAFGTILLPGINNALQGFIQLTDSMRESAGSIAVIERNTHALSNALKDVALVIGVTAGGVGILAGIKSLEAAYASLYVITARTTALQVAFATLLRGQFTLALLQARNAVLALTAAMSINPYVALATALAGLTTAVIVYNRNKETTVKIAQQNALAAEQEKRKFEEQKSSMSTLAARYDELAKKKNKTKKEEEEFVKIQNTLLTTFPDIKAGLEGNGKAVELLAGKYKNLSKNALEARKAMLISEIRDIYNKNTPEPLPEFSQISLGRDSIQAYKNMMMKSYDDIKKLVQPKVDEIKAINADLMALDIKPDTNKTPAGGEVVNEEALKSYEKIKDALSKEAYDLQLDSQVRNLLGIPSEMEIGERLQVSFDLIKEYLAKEREITLSDAKNKGELYLQLQNVYKEKEIQSLKEYDKKYLEEKQADEIKGQEIIAQAKFDALKHNTKVTQEVLQNNIKRLGDLSRDVFQTMTQSGLSFGERMRNVFQELLFYMAKMSAIQAFTGMAASGGGSGILGIIGKIGLSALSFDTGGIVPGSFSQPVPITAHGSEMVLNPRQQAKLWNAANGGSMGGGQPVIVHNSFTINAMDGRSVERMLIEKREFINGMVADGIRKGGVLKAAVRGA